MCCLVSNVLCECFYGCSVGSGKDKLNRDNLNTHICRYIIMCVCVVWCQMFSVNVSMAVLWAVGKDKLNRDNLNTHICRYIIMCVCVVWCQMFSVNVFMAAFCRQCERQLKHTYMYTYRYVMCVCCCLWMFYGSILWTVGETLVGCLTSQQHASVSQGRICSDNFTCCHTETEVADQTFYLTQSQYTDAGPTSPSADPITQVPGRLATGVPIFKSLVWLDPGKNLGASGVRTRNLPLSRQTP